MRRCHALRRRLGTNWKAPSRQKTVAPTMWTITGAGTAKKRAFSVVTVGAAGQLAEPGGAGARRAPG